MGSNPARHCIRKRQNRRYTLEELYCRSFSFNIVLHVEFWWNPWLTSGSRDCFFFFKALLRDMQLCWVAMIVSWVLSTKREKLVHKILANFFQNSADWKNKFFKRKTLSIGRSWCSTCQAVLNVSTFNTKYLSFYFLTCCFYQKQSNIWEYLTWLRTILVKLTVA